MHRERRVRLESFHWTLTCRSMSTCRSLVSSYLESNEPHCAWLASSGSSRVMQRRNRPTAGHSPPPTSAGLMTSVHCHWSARFHQATRSRRLSTTGCRTRCRTRSVGLLGRVAVFQDIYDQLPRSTHHNHSTATKNSSS